MQHELQIQRNWIYLGKCLRYKRPRLLEELWWFRSAGRGWRGVYSLGKWSSGQGRTCWALFKETLEGNQAPWGWWPARWFEPGHGRGERGWGLAGATSTKEKIRWPTQPLLSGTLLIWEFNLYNIPHSWANRDSWSPKFQQSFEYKECI